MKGFGGRLFCYFDLEIVWRWEPLKHIALIKCSIWESQMSQNIWNTRNIHHCLKGPSKALIAWSNNSASKIVNEKIGSMKTSEILLEAWEFDCYKITAPSSSCISSSSSSSEGRTETVVRKSHTSVISLTLAINRHWICIYI